MSKLLLNEYPLLVSPTLAVKIGLNESLILQQIHYWLEINKKANKNFVDNYYWTFNSYEQWQEQFPFWSIPTIVRAIKSLEKMKLVISDNHNKLKIDRTKWYRIDYKALETLETSPFNQIDKTNLSKWLEHLTKMTRPLPETIDRDYNSETTKAYLHNSSNCGVFYFLSDIDDDFIQTYLSIMGRWGYEHKKVSNKNLRYILEAVELLKAEDVDISLWEKCIDDYFRNLPSGNDGDITAFLYASRRYFGVDINYEIGR